MRMTEPAVAIRPVAGKVKDRRVTFNQVVAHRESPPAGVALFAIEPDYGLRVWVVSHRTAADVATIQIRDVYDCISMNVDSAPAALGDPIAYPLENIPEALWEKMLTAKTNALHKIFADALSGVLSGLGTP